jgi:hypothetical protein
VFPEIMKNFCIGIFWSFIMKFGERARKPFQEYRALKGVWPNLWIWPRFLL